MALTKIAETTLYAIAQTSSNVNSLGSSIDVSTYYEATIRIRIGRGTGTAFTVQPKIRLQWTAATSPTEQQWSDLEVFAPLLGAAIANTTTTNTANAATTTVAAATNLAAGDFIFIQEGTIANSEWLRVISIASLVVTPQANVINAHTATALRDQAEEYAYGPISLLGINKLRIQVDNAGTGQALVVEAVIGAVTAL